MAYRGLRRECGVWSLGQMVNLGAGQFQTEALDSPDGRALGWRAIGMWFVSQRVLPRVIQQRPPQHLKLITLKPGLCYVLPSHYKLRWDDSTRYSELIRQITTTGWPDGSVWNKGRGLGSWVRHQWAMMEAGAVCVCHLKQSSDGGINPEPDARASVLTDFQNTEITYSADDHVDNNGDYDYDDEDKEREDTRETEKEEEKEKEGGDDFDVKRNFLISKPEWDRLMSQIYGPPATSPHPNTRGEAGDKINTALQRWRQA
ncbi:hypothetical protein EGW08_006842 [Elysia chlorotica]|uniref:Uncharacterized protein n=1 Tax=Elysia chlorotica TaxID=188477 RepID=A0A433TV38_ELYCH|nr:hypothetical protein EGW08_006842 [Elysia chlorotica]